MSNLSIDVSRLDIAVSGVSSEVVREAVNGLDSELERVLGATSFALTGDLSVAGLELDPIEVGKRIDAGSLSRLIAERLGVALARAAKGGR